MSLLLNPRSAADVYVVRLSTILTSFSVLRQAVQKRIAAMPRHWIIATQTFRLGVEWVLHMEHVRGNAPVQVRNM